MKTLLSLALFSLLLNMMTYCASETKSSNSDNKSKEEVSVPQIPQEPQDQEYRVVYEYYPPEGKSYDELSDLEKILYQQIKDGIARCCTIVDDRTRTITITLARELNDKNSGISDDYSHYSTETYVSHANVPEYAKSEFSCSANGRTESEATFKAESMLLKNLMNYYNQLYNYNRYCQNEISFLSNLLHST